MNPVRALLLSCLLASVAAAKENTSTPGVSTSDDGAVVSYSAEYFAQFRPITALDMLRWIPGTSDIVPENNFGGGNNNQERGFGSGGDQVLINGRRISGKSISVATAVQRIQADVVERIDVIRGTTSGLDVRSEGLIINIILSEDADSGSGSWQVHLGDYGEVGTKPDGLVSWNHSLGRFKYLLSAEYGPFNRGSTIDRIEQFFVPDSSDVFERRDILIPEDEEAYKLNASGSWTFANSDTLNLNGQYEDAEEVIERTIVTTFPGLPNVETALELQIEKEIEWEFGGDLVNNIGPGQLKTRLILTSEDEREINAVEQSSNVDPNVPPEALVDTDGLATERIIRSSYSWPLQESQRLEIGVEGAANALEKTVRLFERQPDGSLIEIPLINADSDVKEDRYEVFATHFWDVAPGRVLESALNVEYSEIAQFGQDVDIKRDFTFVKPRFDFRWDLNERDQLRMTFERTVSQLDFGDFVLSFDQDDNQISGGNPNLRPETAWEYNATFEHRLTDNRGLVSARAFFSDIQDHIDRIEVIDGVGGAGNIGDASLWGLELKGSLRLGAIGLDGAVVDVVYTWQDSRTTDPFTGASRDISNKPANDVEIKFRHDIPAWRLNYVVDFRWRDERFQNDFNFRQRNTDTSPNLTLTSQYQAFGRTIVYLQVRALLDTERRRERIRYDGNIGDGIRLRDEVRDQTFRREFSLGLRGQF